MSIDDEETQLDRLISTVYGGPFEDFVRRRDALVKELRSAGRREDASLIKRLRKPSRMAWALDVAALQSREALDALDSAVGATIEAHATGRDVRGAIARLRVAVREFAAHAARAAVDAEQRVEEAALANAVLAVLGNADAFSALRRGRLADVPDAGGLDFLSSLPTPPPAVVRAKPETPRASAAAAASAASAPAPSATTSALPSPTPPSRSAAPPSPPSAPSPEAVAVERAARDALREARNAVAHARQRLANAQQTLSETESSLRAREDQLRQLEDEVRALRDQRDDHHEESEDAAAQLLEAERTLADAEAQLERLAGEA